VKTVSVVCAWVMRADGRILLVRKANTALFLFPGGKPEPGETAEETLRREVVEELGCAWRFEHDRWPGDVLRAPAANEAGFDVEATLLQVELDGLFSARAEIAEIAWVDRTGRDDDGRLLPCAPLTDVAWSAYDGWMISAKSSARRA
jgi:8-oxo-dGTP diphosphatase